MAALSPSRTALVAQALRLEALTIAWNVVEAGVALAAAVAAGSVALFGFGVDSVVESASGVVLVWRLLAERRGLSPDRIEALDRRAHRLVGASLGLLAAWVALDAVRALATGDRPEASPVGIALTSVSLVAMVWLARAKRRVAARLESRALEADAFQTTACFWLSATTLAGIALNAALGWWWADPAAALAMTAFIGREAWQAWRGEDCGCALPAAAAREPAAAACGCAGGCHGAGERAPGPASAR